MSNLGAKISSKGEKSGTWVQIHESEHLQSIYDDVETKDIDGRSSPQQRAVTGMTFQRTGSAGEESDNDQLKFLCEMKDCTFAEIFSYNEILDYLKE